MRQISKRERETGKPKFNLDSAVERNDMTRLSMILSFGFGVASGYSKLSRDRFMPELQNGKTLRELKDFCAKHLNGSQVPGSDPLQDGPVLLRMFQAAEIEGFVTLKFEKAEAFVPEKGM